MRITIAQITIDTDTDTDMGDLLQTVQALVPPEGWDILRHVPAPSPIHVEPQYEVEPEYEPEPEYESADEPSNGAGEIPGIVSGHHPPEELQKGRTALHGLVTDWIVGWNCGADDEGSPLVAQPDRMKLVQRVMATSGTAIFCYIDYHGQQAGRTRYATDPCTRGLRAAIHSVLTESMVPEGVDPKDFGDDIAGNIVQLSSISVPPLAETIEYTHEDCRG